MTSDCDHPRDPHAALRARLAQMEHELLRLVGPSDLRHQLANAVASLSMTLALLDQSLPSELRGRLEGMLTHEAAWAETVLAAAVRPS